MPVRLIPAATIVRPIGESVTDISSWVDVSRQCCVDAEGCLALFYRLANSDVREMA